MTYFMADIRPITALEKNLGAILKTVRKTCRPMVLKDSGCASVILIDAKPLRNNLIK